jgi:cell fate regulator YaaT (PSP1 superfamily)
LTEVISVRFAERGKKYLFDPQGVDAHAGDKIVVETAKGLELGTVAEACHAVEDADIIRPLRGAVRIATAEDLKTEEANRRLEKEAMVICKDKIAAFGLDMKLVAVECAFDGNKILFYFTSDGRVDFRELVKDLASVFRTRIELRQIGVRDETKLLGGLGICGRPYCCSQFLRDFEPISTKMAKNQSMSLNPAKISGSCGRLMCCLRYEQEAYESLVKNIPRNGAFVQTTGGYGSVLQSNVLRQQIKVRMDGTDETDIRVFDADQVATVPGGRPKAGESLPNVLKYVPPEEPEVPEEDPWKAPQLFAESEAQKEKPKSAQQRRRRKKGQRKDKNR